MDCNNTGDFLVAEYSTNGLFDPNLAFGGHQPHLFDQWMTLYDEYTVIGSRMYVQALGFGDGNNKFPANWGISLQDTSGRMPATLSGANAIEKGMIPGFMASVGAVNAVPNKSQSYRSKSWSLKKTYGSKAGTALNPRFVGNATKNPDEQSVFVLWMINETSTDPPVCHFMVHIDYICIFSQFNWDNFGIS